MKTELTAEESLHLIDLGVPKELASGSLSYGFAGSYPIFKLEDFLNGEILPKIIYTGKGHCPLIIKYKYINDAIHAKVYYAPAYDFPTYLKPSPTYFKEELIDALYQLACWYYGEHLKSEENGNN